MSSDQYFSSSSSGRGKKELAQKPFTESFGIPLKKKKKKKKKKKERILLSDQYSSSSSRRVKEGRSSLWNLMQADVVLPSRRFYVFFVFCFCLSVFWDCCSWCSGAGVFSCCNFVYDFLPVHGSLLAVSSFHCYELFCYKDAAANPLYWKESCGKLEPPPRVVEKSDSLISWICSAFVMVLRSTTAS